jgi:ABC-type sugar transport system substrate-binding protein
MAEKFPDIKVNSKPFDWSSEKCSTVAQTVLSTEDIDGIYTASEIGCLKPVTSALKAVGRYAPVGDAKHMPFVGIDGSPESLQAVRDGYMDAVVSQPLNAYAEWAIYWVNRAINGDPTEEGRTDHNSTVVKEGSSYLDLLESPTVTKDNVDDPGLWGNG